ncbi:MAG: hypothetical protein ACKOFI_00075, partial [Phycisphaerales bacterium]
MRLSAPTRASTGESHVRASADGSTCAARAPTGMLWASPRGVREATNAAASTADHAPSAARSRTVRPRPSEAASSGLRASDSPRAATAVATASATEATSHAGRSTCDGNDDPRPASASTWRIAGPEPCSSTATSGA